MSRPKRCAVCAGDPAIRAQIDAMLTSGLQIKVIVEQVAGFSRDQISRHRSRCLVPAVAAETPTATGSAQIEKWLGRAESTYLAAQSLGDTKSAISAVSAAVRSLSALHKQVAAETAAAEKKADSPDRALTISDCDRMLREFRAKHREDQCYYCGRPWSQKEQEKTNPDAITN